MGGIASSGSLLQMHNRRAPAAEMFVREMKFHDLRRLRQQRVNRAPQMADALPMNDPHPENPALLTLREIIRDEVFHLVRSERVQVQHAINRKLDRLVVAHRKILTTEGHGGKRIFRFEISNSIYSPVEP